MQLIEHLRNLDDLIVRGANTAKIRNQLSACIEQAEAEMDCPEKLSALQAKHSELQNAHQKAAIDDEIRRKESKEASDELLQETKNLTEQINKLTGQVIELVGIAEEQKRLAAKLDSQTDTLISLTQWLRGLTIALVILAL